MSSKGQEVTKPNEYRDKMFGLVAGREPIDIMKETTEVLSSIAEGYPVDVLRRRPFPGKWTPIEILGHLVDAEWVYGYRLRTVLLDNRPQIVPMDQELWVTGQQYNQRDPKDLVKQFKVLRMMNIFIIKHLTPEQKQREGLHAERGPETIDTMLKMLAGHDLNHIAQLKKYLDAILDEESTSDMKLTRVKK